MIIIGNGTLLTNDPARPMLADGAVAVDGNVIREVGDTAALRAAHPGHEFVDARGGLIMPGLVNAHHHFYSALARGMMVERPRVSKNFQEILENLWYRLDRALTMEDVAMSATVSLIDSIKSGVTAIVDHHASFGAIAGSLDAIAGAARQAGVRVCTCFEVSDRHGEAAAREAIAENRRFLDAVGRNGDGMLAGLFGLHASFTLSDETLGRCRDAAGDDGFHVHVAEGRADVEDCLLRHGKRVVERLSDFGILGDKTLAVHCIHVAPGEMDILADSKTTVVHNPQSNMGNAVGCSPLLQFLERGVRVGIGTDGYTHDVLESAKAAGLLQRHHLADPSAAWSEPYDCLLGANPEAAGRMFGVRLGVLAQGAAADVITVDYASPTPVRAENRNAHLHFGVGGPLVRHSVINGAVVMKDRELVTLDEKHLLARSRELAAQLWKKL